MSRWAIWFVLGLAILVLVSVLLFAQTEETKTVGWKATAKLRSASPQEAADELNHLVYSFNEMAISFEKPEKAKSQMIAKVFLIGCSLLAN